MPSYATPEAHARQKAKDTKVLFYQVLPTSLAFGVICAMVPYGFVYVLVLLLNGKKIHV